MNNQEIYDEITAMRVAMIGATEDAKWREVDAVVPGDRLFHSPDDRVCFGVARDGTHWAFGYDHLPIDAPDIEYHTFAEGATWILFERAFLLAQALCSEEMRPGFRDLAFGKWWDSFDMKELERYQWFRDRGLREPAAPHRNAWRVLDGYERESIIRTILKGVTK